MVIILIYDAIDLGHSSKQHVLVMGAYKKKLIGLLGELIQKIEKMEGILLDKNNAVDKRDELLTVSQASQYVHLAVSTIYSKVSSNAIPVCKKGKRLYFSRFELDDWISTGRRKTFRELRDETDSANITGKRRS